MNFREVGISIHCQQKESMITEQEITQNSEQLTHMEVTNEDEVQAVVVPSTKFQPCPQILTDPCLTLMTWERTCLNNQFAYLVIIYRLVVQTVMNSTKAV